MSQHTLIPMSRIEHALYGLTHITISSRFIKGFAGPWSNLKSSRPQYAIRLNKSNRHLSGAQGSDLIGHLLANPVQATNGGLS